MATRKDFVFIETPGRKPQHTQMVENFADLILRSDTTRREEWLRATAMTQGLLDAIWRDIQSTS